MKKIVTILLSFVLMFSLFVGCGDKDVKEHSSSVHFVEPYVPELPDMSDVSDDPLPIEDEEPTVSMKSTPDSSCFSEIGYDDWTATLYVRFRDSGSLYSYEEFYDWDSFRHADSLGSYYNSYIKGQYECHRLE